MGRANVRCYFTVSICFTNYDTYHWSVAPSVLQKHPHFVLMKTQSPKQIEWNLVQVFFLSLSLTLFPKKEGKYVTNSRCIKGKAELVFFLRELVLII